MGIQRGSRARALFGALIVGKAGAPGTAIKRMYKTTATLDPASIAGGAVGTVTVTIAGAKVGDLAQARPRAALNTGLVIGNVIVTTNTVTISILNTTGGALDPVSQTWDVFLIGF